ncbi:MAG: hypothetical protein QOJ16_2643 [Acidobacteriota bacterium]|nr:hypothetical protein [Acidobacteriota bacterium]
MFFGVTVQDWATYLKIAGIVASALSIIVGFFYKFVFWPSVYQKIDAKVKEVNGGIEAALKDANERIVALEKTLGDQAGISSQIATFVFQIELFKNNLAQLEPEVKSLSPAMQKDKNEIKLQIDDLRRDLAKTKNALVVAAANMMQGA